MFFAVTVMYNFYHDINIVGVIGKEIDFLNCFFRDKTGLNLSAPFLKVIFTN